MCLQIAAAKDKLRKLPTPSPFQLLAIEVAVEHVYREHGLTKAEVQIRKKFVRRVEHFLQEDIKGVKLHLYGSVRSGFGLKSSDLNIDLETPSEMKLATGLKMTYESLKKSEICKDVDKDFLAKVPSVYFRSNDKHQLFCQITVNSILARQTSQLLEIYSSIDIRAKKLAVALRYWAKLCRVDRQQEGTLPAYCTYLMTVYFLQRIPNPILPVYHVRPTDEKQRERFFEIITNAALVFPVKNVLNVGELWLELLKFYCQGFDSSSTVISINYETKLTRVAKNWKTKRLAIEDPFSTKRNIARSVSGRKIFEYFQDCLVKTCLYFGFPPTANASKSNSNRKKDSNEQESSVASLTTTTVKTTITTTVATTIAATIEAAAIQVNGANNNKDQNNMASAPDLLIHTPKVSDDKVMSVDEPMQKPSQPTSSSDSSDPVVKGASDDDSMDSSEDIHTSSQRSATNRVCGYVFSVENLSDGKGPAKVCSICEKEGHLKNNCPEEKLPALLPLPTMTEVSLKLLNDMLLQIPKDLGPTDWSTEDREKIVKGLECLIREWYPEARLHLFGSSCNGFGFQNSDLDICITFCNHQNADDLDCVSIIESLSQKLRENKQLYGVVAITTAKVPIVKFKLKNSNLEGDISLYNTLAQHNTKLLKLYTEIDQRVAILGYALKVFAKVCEIGDASKGSLSSYAYILMLLHYLQQCDPPVIPVLQELYEGEKPVHLVDSWNAWFFEDLANLKNTWKYCGQNKQSVAELWIGLFVFYTEKFDVQMVVTIRQHSELSKLEKLWNGKCLAIEDPFDITHNLGAGLSRKMNNYILKTFINGRNVYGTPISQIPPNYETLGDFYFDANRLKEGKPPTDRCCHACGKIGHIVMECPMKRSKRNKENNNNKQDASQQKRDNISMNRENWSNPHHQRPLQPNPLVPNAAHDGSNHHHHLQQHHHHHQQQKQQHHQQLQQQHHQQLQQQYHHQQQQRHHQQQQQHHHQQQQQLQQQHHQKQQMQQQHHQKQQQQHYPQQKQQQQQQHQQTQQPPLHPGTSYPNMYNMNYAGWPTDKNAAVQQFPSTTVVSSHLQPISSMVPSSHSCHPVSGPERAMTMLKPAPQNKSNHQPVQHHRPNMQGPNAHSYQNQHMYLNTRHDQNRRDFSLDDLKGGNMYRWGSHPRQQQY